jgi:peptidoglycan/xylan/chitin deacetylase (PgdA/CDA1 family)
MRLSIGMRRVRLLVTALASSVTLFVAAPLPGVSPAARAAAPTTIVTIQFDDGVADQYQTLTILQDHGMHATFYINSGFIDDTDHLSWLQLTDLFGAGNEIAGHTVTHTNVKKLKTVPARHAVCDDRIALFNHGFQPESFAYPFGSIDAGAEAAVKFCGYNSGRGVSGVNDRKVFGETVPPLDSYATRTPPNPKQGTTLATIEGYVTAAEMHGGGWVQFVFHHVCDGCDAYSITRANLIALLDWLEPRAAAGTVVETTAQVVGGVLQPPVPAE